MVIEGVSPYRAFRTAVNDTGLSFIDWLSWHEASSVETYEAV